MTFETLKLREDKEERIRYQPGNLRRRFHSSTSNSTITTSLGRRRNSKKSEQHFFLSLSLPSKIFLSSPPPYLVLSDGSSVTALLAAVRHRGGRDDVLLGPGRVGGDLAAAAAAAAAVVLVERLVLGHGADAHKEALGELVHFGGDHSFSLWPAAGRMKLEREKSSLVGGGSCVGRVFLAASTLQLTAAAAAEWVTHCGARAGPPLAGARARWNVVGLRGEKQWWANCQVLPTH